MRKYLGTVIALVILCVGLVVWGLGLMPFGRSRDETATVEGVARLRPEASTIGQFIPLDAPRPAPEIAVTTLAGETVRLSDFRGRPVLVNLWATWCGPCVREMPTLDRLQAKLGGSGFTILAISEDRDGAQVVAPFLDKLRLAALKTYLDPKGQAGTAFHVRGLPTSILIDAQGNMRGLLEGATEWDAPAMIEEIQRRIGTTDPASGVIKTSAPR